MNSSISRALFTVGAAGSTLLLGTGIAAAHVTVDAPGAAKGGYTVLTFKVPTESDTAATTKLTVTLPNFKSARTEPIPGWKSEVAKDTGKLATSVTWTADPGVGVAPGQFQRFVLSVGPLPNDNELSFAAEQTYSDGKVVKWDQPMQPNGGEPEYPAPSIQLAAEASGDGDHHNGGGTPEAAASDEHSTTDDTARWLGGIGLVLGALGAAGGIGAVLRSRRS